MPADKIRQVTFIQSLDRGLTILQAVALSKHPVSLGELAALLDIDRSSAFRLAYTLRRRGFLACPAGRKDYILGSSIWRLSHQYDWGNMLVRVANQHLKRLAAQINETAHLAIREGKNALFIDSASTNHMLAVSGQTGELVPLYCSAHGKALLADADEQELKSLYGPDPLRRYTKNTITSIQALAKNCALIKKRGFAADEAEFREELRCVAAPIRVENDAIVASIGISAPITRFPKERYRVYAEHVIKVAQDIGLLLSNPEQNAESEQNAVPLL
jgi:DNA-binding IclR family transcriptional regulator